MSNTWYDGDVSDLESGDYVLNNHPSLELVSSNEGFWFDDQGADITEWMTQSDRTVLLLRTRGEAVSAGIAYDTVSATEYTSPEDWG